MTSKVNSQALSTITFFLKMTVKIKLQKHLNKYHRVFEGVGKHNKDQVHLFINDKVPSVTQKARHSPHKMREKVSNELKM